MKNKIKIACAIHKHDLSYPLQNTNQETDNSVKTAGEWDNFKS